MKTVQLCLPLALIMLAAPAVARQNPNPPPSGIVVHLFGPDGITNHILPTFPGGAAASNPAPGTATSGAATSGAAASGTSASGSAATAASYPEPTMGDVLHQMFVVGDPDQKPGAALAPGRAAEHPQAVNP